MSCPISRSALSFPHPLGLWQEPGRAASTPNLHASSSHPLGLWQERGGDGGLAGAVMGDWASLSAPSFSQAEGEVGGAGSRASFSASFSCTLSQANGGLGGVAGFCFVSPVASCRFPCSALSPVTLSLAVGGSGGAVGTSGIGACRAGAGLRSVGL